MASRGGTEPAQGSASKYQSLFDSLDMDDGDVPPFEGDGMDPSNPQLHLSGKDLLDLFGSFNEDLGSSGENRLDKVSGLSTATAVPPLEPDFPLQGGFEQVPGQGTPLDHSMHQKGGKERMYESLGRCLPVGGAFDDFYAPGFDDRGYSEGLQTQANFSPMQFESMLVAPKLSGLRLLVTDKERQSQQSGSGTGSPDYTQNSSQSQSPGQRQRQSQRQLGRGDRKKKGEGSPSKQGKGGGSPGEKKKLLLKPHPVVEKARRDGINALIEKLREIVPHGGWGNETDQSSCDLSSGEPVRDKRTKRQVLLDTISSINTLKSEMERNAQMVNMAAGVVERQPSRGPGEDELRKVSVDIVQADTGPMYIRIEYYDRRGFLADQCVAMRSLGLTIKTASLPKPERSGRVRDIFEVEPQDCVTNVDVEALREQLCDALNETQSIYYDDKVGEKRTRT